MELPDVLTISHLREAEGAAYWIHLDTEIDSFETPAALPSHAQSCETRESIRDSRAKVALRAHSEAQQEQSRGTSGPSGVALATCVAVGMVAMRLTSSVVNSAQLRVRT